MRDLKSSEKNLMAIHDIQSGTFVGFYYRTPTTKERIKYNSEQVRALHTNNYDALFEIQLEWGDKIITGIPPNSFCYGGKEISSDPESDNYDQNWLRLLKEAASDLIAVMIDKIMNKTSYVLKASGVSEDFFTKSSGNTTEPGLKKSDSTI